jgi:uncharacterized protein (DUF1697 family)
MSRFIALLRAINVGGARTVKMEFLRQLFESLGFSEVATFIASGNVVFETTAKDPRALESKIEKRLQEGLGYDVVVFIRTDAELAEIANYEPFRQSEMDSADLNILFLADKLDDKSERKVRALSTDTDEFCVRGREIYWLRRRQPDGAAFTTVPLEKTLGRPFTIRGAKTVKRMAEKYCSAKS